MKPSSFLVQAAFMLLVIGAAIGCDYPPESPSNSSLLDRQAVADIFGNHDGVATPDELLALDDFFQANAEAWCVSSLSDQLRNSDEASADQAKACFLAIATRPYPSEQALRQAYKGINIKTPYVSIAVLQNNKQLHVTKFFRSPGPGVSSAHWDLLTVE